MLEQFLSLEEQPYTDEDAEWDDFVATHPHGSLLQTTQWARLKNRFGWKSHRVWLKREGRLAAGAQLLFRQAALGLIRFAYIPHGPLVNWDDEEQVFILFNQIDLAAYEQRVGMLKIEPLLWHSEVSQDKWDRLCKDLDCLPNTKPIQPPRTMVVDLRSSEEKILAAMKQKTRYNIRLATKKGVTVRKGSAEDLSIFNNLMTITGERNAFGVHSPAYYKAAFDLFTPNNVALLIAEYEGRPLSALMAFMSGTRAAYLYGASSTEERHRMPAYALQWAAMLWAKERGGTEYDLWGVPDHPEQELESGFKDRQNGLWGVYRFKRGFGGQLQRTVGSADRIYNNLVYRLYQWRRG
jgi:lipid II:glycine glycyltransferase (peptidoglycan interpeptide bridge formation enzyme)